MPFAGRRGGLAATALAFGWMGQQLRHVTLHQRHRDRLACRLGGVENVDCHELGGVGLAHGHQYAPIPRGGVYANAYANQLDFGGVRGCPSLYEKRCGLRKLVTHTHVRTGCVCLGIKWSQVQILSARHF
jgi:hypothetical protein